jgi:iron-sulfur cluster repair protein YtfE (RIC family)
MLTLLGRPAAPGDCVDLLVECHGRIRSFLALGRRLGQARGTGPDELADAAFRVHRYFTLALPLHALDEEESIAPRLRGRDPAVDAELETMVREHREHQGPLAALVEACAVLAREPGRHPELAPAVERSAAELERHFVAHLAREEQVIFPAVRRLLDRAADAAVVEELRRRRGQVLESPAAPASRAR